MNIRRINLIIAAIAAVFLLSGCTKDNIEDVRYGFGLGSLSDGGETIEVGEYNVTLKLHESIPDGDVLVWAGLDKSGTSVVIKTANEAGRKLVCLLDDGRSVAPVVNGQYFTFTISDISKDISATICYEYFELKAFVYPSCAGNISEYETRHQPGDDISLEVTPGELGDGGSFVCWKDKEGNIVSDQLTVDFAIDADVTLVAVFDVNYGTDVLSGVFTVASDNGCGEQKKVRFSKGGLWYGVADENSQSASFNFESEQWGFADEWNKDHVSHFYWSPNAASTYKELYDEYSKAKKTDIFFANKADFVINGVSAWYNLSNEEWKYLINRSGRTKYSVSIDGKKGNVLAPDDFSGTINSTYTVSEWKEAEREHGLVFIPYEGYRDGSALSMVQFSCLYWTGTNGADSNLPYGAYYFSMIGGFHMASKDRYYGESVRLVSDYIEEEERK